MSTFTFQDILSERRYKEERYRQFLEGKIIQTPPTGFKISPSEVNTVLKPHQKDIVMWALEGGTRAIFARFGLGKTIMQLEIGRHVIADTGKPFLIGMPLGVKQEFIEDAQLLGLKVFYVRDASEIEQVLIEWSVKVFEDGYQTKPIFLSNYERIREGKFNLDIFGGVSFDEGDAIRNLDTETTDYILKSFGNVKYRFIATATPSPNDYTELLNYAQFLGVMDRSQVLTRFFQRNSTTADVYCLQVEDDASFTAEGCIVKNCPLQFDIIDRAVIRYSNPGDLIFDPFGGIMSTPYRCIALNRRSIATELNPQYWSDGVEYCKAASYKKSVPTLFDVL